MQHRATTLVGEPLTAPQSRQRFRPDIEGLRAVAVVLVLLYHAGLKVVPGGFVGVDVFFVISGFLITGLLVREVEHTGRLRLGAFYARRAKRLLPATALLLTVTSVLTWQFLPVTQRAIFGGDIRAAALYVVNWRFASRSVDYLAEGVSVSPVQHLWSLAVEEQFYIVWPLLILVLLRVARRRGVLVRPLFLPGLALIVIPSFAWSVLQTSMDPKPAFFDTSTRLWELGIGAAVAISASTWRSLTRPAAVGLVGIGSAAILGSAVLLHSSSPWPGALALVPTFGTAAVIMGGSAGGGPISRRLLSSGPFVWVGGLSYSLYLWHWPLLVAARADGHNTGAAAGLLIVAVSVVPAYLSNQLLENPVRFSAGLAGSTSRALGVGAVCTLVGALAGYAVIARGGSTFDPVDRGAALGARALKATPATNWATVNKVAGLTPDPTLAAEDVPATYADKCHSDRKASPAITCEYGDRSSSFVVVLVGDSKMSQWTSAFDAIGQARHWHIVTLLKSRCAFADGALLLEGEIFDSCVGWNGRAMKRMKSLDPDLVVTSQGAYQALENERDASSPDTSAAMIRDLVSRWQEMSRAHIPVVVIPDNPAPPQQMPECVAEHATSLSECTFIARPTVADVQRAAAAAAPQVGVLDMIDLICPAGSCPGVIGNVLVYRQGSHLTKTYIDSLRPALEKRLLAILDRIAPQLRVP